ncbi:PREDICTED: ovostatin homolog isoform X1 [Chinchilla lanigera]|uniref:ovostatin homolog isoform X1 n=1 Tax=Chinchilla lanigera TaxID=34839 RepID=UPI00038F0CC8|nr:PREDICTED: ovostatin homolog isoform X1 [Chinchilla lanigera]
MMSSVLLCTFLLHFTAAVASNPQYILWVSSVVQCHSMEKVCLHLLNLNESVSLNVVLEYNGSNTTIFDLSVEEDTFYSCAHFKVSQKSSEQLAFITLWVKGNTLTIFERRSVAITTEETVTFVQTDKPIYKPGEKINYRTVTLDTQFKPVEDLYPSITLQDPQNNVIFQWKNVTSFQNITQLSFQLSSEPMFGDYTIVVEEKSGQTWAHQFTVNKDVLPKFEVKVSAPQTITISDDEFQVDACAKYTYGGSVHGKAQIRVCRELLSSRSCEEGVNEICEQFVAQLGNGCVSQTVNTKVFQINRSGLFMTFHINVIVTESGTGVQISEKTSVAITELLGSVHFENMDSVYRRGISYFGTLKFYGPNNVPLTSKVLQLELNGRVIGNYTTDENGEAPFSIDTSDIYDPMFSLKATFLQPQSCHLPSWVTPHYSEASFVVSRFYSRTNSFLKIVPTLKQLRCNQVKIVTVHYSLNHEAYMGASSVNFFYLVMAKGAIILNGQKELRNKAWKGSFSLSISISADLAPVAVLLVYTVHPSGEIVADSVKFQIDQCFKNKVSIQFSEAHRPPGSNTTLYLQAAPDSFCALRAVDKSVLLLKPEQQLSAESVYNMLPYTELYGYFYNGLNLDDGRAEPCIPQKNMFYNGLYYMPVPSLEDGDTYEILMHMGLKVFTNLHYRKPELCTMDGSQPYLRPLYLGEERYVQYAAPAVANFELRESASHVQQAIIETVRTNFPETWIWDLFSVDSSGSANLSFVTPDSLTEWEASAFCVNGQAGFGISSTVSLRVSQAFFVEIASPVSVVRNEQCDLIVSVFSYLNTCAEISVQLETSQDYEASINTLKSNKNEIIQAGEKKTYVWTLIPQNLGKVDITVVAQSRQSSSCRNKATEEENVNWKDVVVKSILVEPEGIEKEMTQSFLICTKGTKASKEIVLDLPNDIVEGSARAFLIVIGDILGVAMQNLESLLQMPYGWEEQNIALLAANTYVLDYLRATKQLTEEVKSKAVFLLSNGYQKQLSFKNFDGSYSMFWQRNKEGNIWFSTRTYETFERMKEYIFIDKTVQKQTLIWLSSKQKENGCFESNDISNNEWEGGEEEDIGLTASVIVMLLEAGLNSTFPALRNGLFCLEDALERGVTSSYTHAILAYTFALAGKEEQVETLLQILDQSATKINNVIYWEKEQKDKADNFPSSSPWAPSEMEKTCYVLLAVLSRRTQDFTYASKIVQWLVQKMNSHGGFSSTQQDTTVCLLAITSYMRLTFSNDRNTVTFLSEESMEIFQVNKENRLLVQRSELTKADGQYTVDVEGQGCVFIQATLKFNVPLPKKSSGFSLSLEIVKNTSSDVLQPDFDLTVTLKYTGTHNNPSVVLVDVKMLSGFTPVMSSIEQLENNGRVMKTEVKNNHVLFYLENVLDTANSFTFSVEQSNLVSNIQPAPVMVYNYHAKDEYAFDSYNIDNISVSQ